ncbi:MAG: CHAT domain-containing tetratricopeptide repeat protein [Bacteroidota bacterium]
MLGARQEFGQGFLDAGLDSAMKAFELAHQRLPRNHDLYSQAIYLVADGYHQIGLTDEAFSFYQQALGIVHEQHGDTHPLYVRGIYGVAGIYKSLGDQNQEDVALRGIVRIQLEVHGPKHPEYAAALFAVSDLYRRAGMFQMAKEGYKTVIEIYETSGKASYTGRLTDCWFGLGMCLFYTEEYDSSAIYFRKAAEGMRQISGEMYGPIGDVLQNLATIHVFKRQIQQAVACFEEAETIYDHQIRYLFSQNSADVRHRLLDQMKMSVSRFVSLTLQQFPGDASMMRKLFELVGKRKSLSLDSLLLQEEQFALSLDPKIKADVERLKQLRAGIAEKALGGPAAQQSLEEHQKQTMQWEITAQKLEKSLLSQSELMRPEQLFQNFSLETLCPFIADDTVLIELLQFTWIDFTQTSSSKGSDSSSIHYLVMTCDRAGKLSCSDLGPAEPIDQAIHSFRSNITGISDNDSPKESRSLMFEPEKSQEKLGAGKRLYELIVQPIQASIEGVKHLLIAPDGHLSRLPIGVLPYKEEGLMIDRYLISYLSTARDLLRPQNRRIKLEPPIVMADPDYDLHISTGKNRQENSSEDSAEKDRLRAHAVRFSALPGTNKEGKIIAKLLGVSPYLREAAVESILHQCRSPRILHLATHGFHLLQASSELDGSTPSIEKKTLKSGLVLAGVNTWLHNGNLPEEAMDGVLNTKDVMKLQLAGTELVVLSACETALGDIVAGEGVLGLSRAVKLAGARSQLLSLWQVPDMPTQELMVTFYEYLLAGKGKAESLHLAKLRIRKMYPAPINWAGFICEGEVGPLALPE